MTKEQKHSCEILRAIVWAILFISGSVYIGISILVLNIAEVAAPIMGLLLMIISLFALFSKCGGCDKRRTAK